MRQACPTSAITSTEHLARLWRRAGADELRLAGHVTGAQHRAEFAATARRF
jgi:hypothetical protein